METPSGKRQLCNVMGMVFSKLVGCPFIFVDISGYVLIVIG